VQTWPPVSLILSMGSISLLLLVEKGFGFEMGQDELIAVVERQIRELEVSGGSTIPRSHPVARFREGEGERMAGSAMWSSLWPKEPEDHVDGALDGRVAGHGGGHEGAGEHGAEEHVEDVVRIDVEVDGSGRSGLEDVVELWPC
jgi:hypothetical protein